MKRKPPFICIVVMPIAYAIIASGLGWHFYSASSSKAFIPLLILSFPSFLLAFAITAMSSDWETTLIPAILMCGVAQYLLLGAYCDISRRREHRKKILRQSDAEFVCEHCDYPVHTNERNRCPECGKIQSE